MLKHNRSPKAKKVKIIKINENQAQFNLNSFLLSVSVVTETSQNTKVYLVVEKSVRGAVCGTLSDQLAWIIHVFNRNQTRSKQLICLKVSNMTVSQSHSIS